MVRRSPRERYPPHQRAAKRAARKEEGRPRQGRKPLKTRLHGPGLSRFVRKKASFSFGPAAARFLFGKTKRKWGADSVSCPAQGREIFTTRVPNLGVLRGGTPKCPFAYFSGTGKVGPRRVGTLPPFQRNRKTKIPGGMLSRRPNRWNRRPWSGGQSSAGEKHRPCRLDGGPFFRYSYTIGQEGRV